MHRKLKNTVEEYVDEGRDEGKQQDKNEAQRALKEREVMSMEDGEIIVKTGERSRLKGDKSFV